MAQHPQRELVSMDDRMVLPLLALLERELVELESRILQLLADVGLATPLPLSNVALFALREGGLFWAEREGPQRGPRPRSVRRSSPGCEHRSPPRAAAGPRREGGRPAGCRRIDPRVRESYGAQAPVRIGRSVMVPLLSAVKPTSTEAPGAMVLFQSALLKV